MNASACWLSAQMMLSIRWEQKVVRCREWSIVAILHTMSSHSAQKKDYSLYSRKQQVGKVMWHKAASPPSADHSIVFAMLRHWSDVIRGSLGPRESAPERHLDQFSRFCTVHCCDQHTTERATYVAVDHVYAMRSNDIALRNSAMPLFNGTHSKPKHGIDKQLLLVNCNEYFLSGYSMPTYGGNFTQKWLRCD